MSNIINRYNAPSEKNKIKICNPNNIFSFDKCSFIEIIVNALKEFNKGTNNNLNTSEILGAYDHVISIHNLCGFGLNKYDEDDNKHDSKPFEDIDHKFYINEVQQYIVKKLNGYCTSKTCIILQNHIMRRRERGVDEKKDNKNDDNKDNDNGDIDDSLNEIRNATMNALHCYILHEKKELFRLERECGNSHFMSDIVDHNQNEHGNIIYNEEEHIKTDETNSIPSLNFGVSVLKWLNYLEQPTFDGFRDEIIRNPESTISSKAWLNYAQECYIKVNNRKYDQYTLDEMMSLKLYTDTDAFCASVRRAHWKSSSKDIKKLFYHW
eukprot:228695_1